MKSPKKQPVEIESYQFSSLPSLGDKILIFTRSHKLYLLKNLTFIIALSALALAITSTIFLFIYPSLLLLLISLPIIAAFTLTFCVREYLGWYFHFFLVTTRKIVEVCNIPFGNYYINEILLDRVKCTEVDIVANGIINQILRIGDVTVTFDRPTQHRDSFIFKNVSNANSIREILTDYFSEPHQETTTWYFGDHKNRGWIYPFEEVSVPKLHA